MAFTLHLISSESFNDYSVPWMCLTFGFFNTWIGQAEGFVENVQVFSGRK